MSSKDPLLSFVIPVYKKSSEVFEKCLRSLFDMSYKRIEVICVFDGPNEELEKVAAKYKTSTFVIDHGGAPKARNFGFTQATGEYVSFWDADCYAKPEMGRMWIEAFKSNPDVDFVYSGYEFANGQGGIASEPFDPYLLECGNYIATMFPVKHSKFPGFDESLKAGQDWDLWLSVVKNGGKGLFIEGFGFITEPPDSESISGKGWSPENFDSTLRLIKAKHGIPQRDIVVGSAGHKAKGLQIAKLLGADFLQFPSWRPHNYKCVLNLGYGEDIRFRNAPVDCLKLQYWMPWDIDSVEGVAYKSAVRVVRNAIKEVDLHLCNEVVSQKRLRNLGIEEGKGIQAKVIPLPTEIDDLETALPSEFRVLLNFHDTYKPLFRDLKEMLPYVKMDELKFMADISQYSLFISFSPNPTVDEPMRRALLNGRNVISNVQAPYTGNIDMDVTVGPFKDALINAIREARTKPFNKAAQDYYKQIADPNKFKESILGIIRENTKPTLEVVR